MTEVTDRELVARSRRRDADAFGTLVERHQQLVYGVALARCRDTALAEDVAQEAFVTAWRDLGRLEDSDRVGPWVAGIARNLAASAARTRSRRERIVEQDAPTGTVATPEDEALAREDRELLARALADVPETHREVLVLHYLQGESVARIASELGIKEDLVKQRLSRGRKALRDSVADRVESALVRVGKRPDLRAGVLVAVAAATTTTTTTAAAAGSGKMLALMTAKQVGVAAVGILAIAGGAWFFSQRDSANGQPHTAASPTTIASGSSMSTSTSAAEAAATAKGALNVRKIDEARRASLLASIRAQKERRVAETSRVVASGGTPPPKLDTSDLDKEYIRSAVREIVPLLAECYQEGLDRDPTMAGKLVVEFTIEGEPDVGGVVGESKVDPKESDIKDATVQQCIGETMHALQIDPPASGGVVTVRYPFEFRPAGPGDADAGSGTMPAR